MYKSAVVVSLLSVVSSACGGGDGGDPFGVVSQGSQASGVTASDGGTAADTAGSGSGPASGAAESGDSTADPTRGSTGDPTGDSTGAGPLELPPPNGGLDYQLGGAYDPPDGVEIVSRDRGDSPAPGLYNICYINGFQTQPDERDFWLENHPDLVVRDGGGNPIEDPEWPGEMLLDTSTAENRTMLAEIVGGWIVQCANDGFAAIEIDNLDSYSRSQGALSQDNAVEFLALLADVAHGEGLPIAQKNSTELLDRAGEMGTDFAVAEECSTWNECRDYVDVYGDAVLMIEYVRQDFDRGCADYPNVSIVLRDVELVTPGDGGYVYDGC